MKAGPKAAVDTSPLPFRPRSEVESERFLAFADKFLRVPKGTGAKGKLHLRDWQVDVARDVLDSGARTVGIMFPRGQGKTTLNAAIALYRFFTGGEGANVCVVAVDERQAGLAFSAARRMVELNEELSARCQIFKDRLYLPTTDSVFQCLPASPTALEGLDYVLALVDEAGVVNRDVFEVVQLAQGKREKSVLVAIGTPGPNLDDQVLLSLRDYHLEHPDDASLRWREFSAAGFEDHPVDCTHCWELANPALDDFLHRDALVALLPPKTRESTFRRARLCQFAADTEGSFLPAGVWEGLSTGEPVPLGAEVVIALDGSFSDDTTALLLGTVAAAPHFHPLRVWERPADNDDWRVPVLEVENTIRQACRDYQVVEIIADPFRWTRTLQVLEQEGLPVVEFPHSPSRLTAATTDLYTSAVNGEISHSGAAKLAAHVAAAVVQEDPRGLRLAKRSRSRAARKIDLAACLVMAHSRATWRAAHRKKRRTVSFSN
ncbi:Terminase OS=Tsukamurella paurometabola (strain ATCC 8368 / DSM / CCUG 35730 / CIP 100753 /JCM 10117 / KCTC 9821 / NBRC 16120 / NCIMB 702349 / NCTC 13040)OX=521096 GN=Tpau_3893 PE=4 SV=1 [Tsukamurella paurometabola]|uniref:Terminase n=1 Tax=Tsukamurella paurometabola (strain ATCC 8368 / DSM 20162 / CCUG 35730 / CIP 100753 / JCM 10117 / KCTC 9821 / NBRC 16120 / NCIMB 702349 / NCTC 13040) TaxID=521096 RepID=D5UMJ1_TSUPD|nr:terminase large subunit [Tsukamurella paurometabola]ADG80465.1 Terminase [Tsukamurella paurometabola DSM 20162]SUP39744.1 Phage terminase-like protein, large subunit [Tsukamurella paurometabola]